MKASGRTTKPMERENSNMPMAISMREIGKTTKQTVTVFTIVWTEQSMKDSGKMIFSTDTESRSGLMVHNMRVITKQVKRKDRVSINGLMGPPS